ncbi:MAG: NUDIX domain-containing protein [Prolixibacteraceae bacterium]|nr:NUDIX domain-containing protein [Prolixibacteraceae bacterium]
MAKIIPNLSVDCVIFGFDFNQLNVLLVERKLDDEKTGKSLIDDWTLTGYHIFEDENFDTAAARILKGLSGLDNIYLEQFYAFSRLDRVNSPNDKLWLDHQSEGFSERIFTVGYFSLIDNTTVSISHNDRNVKWFPITDLPELGFDHKEILEKALEKLRAKLRSEPIGFELLPEKFTVSQLQRLYEVILGTKFDRRNFRKKVLQMKYVIPLDEKQKGVKHKPAQLFIFSKEVYEKTKTERFDFSI